MTIQVDWARYAEVYERYSTGIYGVVNTPRSRVYVGCTYLDFQQRWDNHRYLLEHDHHPSRDLQKDWWLDGPHAFTFVVFQELSVGHPRMDLYEQFWLDSFREAGLYCYNISETIRRHAASKWWLKRPPAIA